jgi:hypothetical protein
MIETAIVLAISLTVTNFAYQAFFRRESDYETATERSFFQIIAIAMFLVIALHQ